MSLRGTQAGLPARAPGEGLPAVGVATLVPGSCRDQGRRAGIFSTWPCCQWWGRSLPSLAVPLAVGGL